MRRIEAALTNNEQLMSLNSYGSYKGYFYFTKKVVNTFSSVAKAKILSYQPR
jgi:hypothetical protein